MSKKLESTLLNMILSLSLISMGMSGALSIVYLKTKGPIEKASKEKEMNAIKLVLPEFDSDPLKEMREKDGLVFYPVYKQGQPAGCAIKTFSDKGFSGHIEIIAGFLPDGSIYNTQVVQHKETPGLGNKMIEPKFKDQFNNKNPGNFKLKVKKDGGDVDAITAATISSRAYCDALQKSYNALAQKTDTVSYKSENQ
jgi:Na+-translocating ferredoxin:NAD+ oxidoreductase subunit G